MKIQNVVKGVLVSLETKDVEKAEEFVKLLGNAAPVDIVRWLADHAFDDGVRVVIDGSEAVSPQLF